MPNYVIRRPKLGRTSVRELVRLSQKGLQGYREDRFPRELPAPEYIFRWGWTGNLPIPAQTVNKAEAIHKVNDKAGFHALLAENGLAAGHFNQQNQPVYPESFPLVVRPRVHAQGRHLYVCRTAQEFNRAVAACGDGWYGSHLIDKKAEYRVFVVSGRVVCVAKKSPPAMVNGVIPVAWNVARGGKFENVRWEDWPLKACRIALAAFSVSDLDFGGVDVMVGSKAVLEPGRGMGAPKEETLVLEINSAPSLTSPYRQKCFSKAFDYIIEHGKDVIPLQKARGDYRKFIHPAVAHGVRA